MSSRRTCALLIALGAAAAAGCGSSSSSSSSSGTAASSTSTAAPAASTASGGSGGSYRILLIGPYKTSLADNSPVIYGATAAAKAINAQGGLKGGVKVSISTCNDQDSPAGASACARQAVQGNYDDVMLNSSFTPQETPILDAAKMPRIGSLNVNPPDYTNPYTLSPFPPDVAGFAAPVVYWIEHKGAKRIVLLTLQLTASQSITNGVGAAVKALHAKYGSSVVDTIAVPLTQTDFASVVQKIKNDHPDFVQMIITQPQAIAFMSARHELGLQAPVSSSTNTLPDSVTSQMVDGGAGMWNGGAYPPYNAQGIPGLQTFVSQMQAAGYTDPAKDYTSFAISFWLSTWALEKISQDVSGPVTKESMLAATRTARSIDLFGIETWNPGVPGPPAYKNNSYGAGFVEQVIAGKNTLASPTAVNYYQVTGLK